MDKRYIELFTLISQTVANLAEQVMNAHQDNNEEKEFETAQAMRNDFLDLHDKLTENASLTKSDYARILVGVVIATTQLENKIKSEQKALQGYKLDIIPKLDQINSAETEEEALTLAESLFKIEVEEKTKDNA